MTQKEKLHEEIAKAAYALFENSGRLQGHDLENWFEAEKIMLGKYEKHSSEIEQTVKASKKVKKGFRKADKIGGRVYRD